MKKITEVNGNRYVTEIGPSPGKLGRLKNGLVGLVEKAFFETHKGRGFTMEVKKVGEDYMYDIDYGEVPIDVERISKWQETARICLDNYIKNDPSKSGVVIRQRYTVRTLDPFGVIRFSRFLLYGGKRAQ